MYVDLCLFMCFQGSEIGMGNNSFNSTSSPESNIVHGKASLTMTTNAITWNDSHLLSIIVVLVETGGQDKTAYVIPTFLPRLN